VTAVLHAKLGRPADVHGVHGTTGVSRWQCLARRVSLHAPWEAVEWASIPPGGVSGEHRHTRTEELYFVLHGEGRITLDGREHPVHAGHLVLTPLRSRHMLRNTGGSSLDWHVIEVVSPPAWRILTGRATSYEEAGMRDPVVLDLAALGEIDARDYLSGAVRTVSLRRLGPHDELRVEAEGVEHTIFVVSGTGTLEHEAGALSLEPGVAVTLPLGARARLRAAEPLRLYHVVLAVEDRQAGGERP
jgi:mannose-6-phosphate isomerase-like protein (cupin superfamily)